MAATEAPTEQLDVARGLENVPVSAWPPGAEPEPFQVGGGAQPPRVRRAAEPAPFCLGGAVLCPRTARAATAVELAPGQVGGGDAWPRGSSTRFRDLAAILWMSLVSQVVSIFST